MTLERSGIPTATLVTHSFAEYGRRLTRLQKMPALPLVVIHHPVAAQPEEDIRLDISKHYPEVVESLISG